MAGCDRACARVRLLAAGVAQRANVQGLQRGHVAHPHVVKGIVAVVPVVESHARAMGCQRTYEASGVGVDGDACGGGCAKAGLQQLRAKVRKSARKRAGS